MWLVVGLGNPGNQYAYTRHNVGFLAVDMMIRGLGNPTLKNQFKGEVALTKIQNHQVVFAKPQTFMNLSGECVQPLMGYYKVEREHLIVFHDDLDIPFGQIRIHKNRGHGGHNGIKSISGLLGSPDYIRIKLGIGRPPHPEMAVADWVLGKWTAQEEANLPEFLNRAGDALMAILEKGPEKAASLYNK
ncbi:MAG: aminoacyl-tRNA hydrolase [Bdellovibrionia bacterium]